MQRCKIMSIFGFKGEPNKDRNGYYTPEIMQRKIDAYFGECSTGETQARVIGLAVKLDLRSKDELLYLMGLPEYTDILQKALLRIEDKYEEAILSRASNGAQFMLRSAFGWKDETTITVNTTDANISNLTDEEILEKINMARAQKAIKNG